MPRVTSSPVRTLIPHGLPWAPIRPERVKVAFDDAEWLSEIKYDGFRAVAVVENDRCELWSRNGHRFQRFGTLQGRIRSVVGWRSVVLDGEIICFDRLGRADFAALFFGRGVPVFMAFDLLGLDGKDWRHRPLIERKRRLKQLVGDRADVLRYVDHVRGQGRAFYQACCQVALYVKWNTFWSIRGRCLLGKELGASGPIPLSACKSMCSSQRMA